MGRRLYVGNLPYSTGEAELQEIFSKAGNVDSVRVMRDAATGRARGLAFVEMATDEDAQAMHQGMAKTAFGYSANEMFNNAPPRMPPAPPMPVAPTIPAPPVRPPPPAPMATPPQYQGPGPGPVPQGGFVPQSAASH